MSVSGHADAAMSLYGELKRRNVLRVATAYVAVSWLLIQVLDTLLPIFGADESIARLVVIVRFIVVLRGFCSGFGGRVVPAM